MNPDLILLSAHDILTGYILQCYFPEETADVAWVFPAAQIMSVETASL